MEIDLNLFMAKIGRDARYNHAAQAVDNFLTSCTALHLFSELTNHRIRTKDLKLFTERFYVDKKAQSSQI